MEPKTFVVTHGLRVAHMVSKPTTAFQTGWVCPVERIHENGPKGAAHNASG